MNMKPRLVAPVSACGMRYGMPELPKALRASPSMISAMPKVSSRPYRWSSLYSRRMIVRSSSSPNAPTISGATISAGQ